MNITLLWTDYSYIQKLLIRYIWMLHVYREFLLVDSRDVKNKKSHCFQAKEDHDKRVYYRRLRPNLCCWTMELYMQLSAITMTVKKISFHTSQYITACLVCVVKPSGIIRSKIQPYSRCLVCFLRNGVVRL
jgi:hypothetical protein